MKKKIYEISLLILSIVLYSYLLFVSDIELGTGKKELENMIVLAIPCLIFLVMSLKSTTNRKKYLVYYLIYYLIALTGFTFSINRMSFDFTLVREFNLIPFESIKEMINSPLGSSFYVYNILGNLLMLTPLAILIPLLFDKFKKKINYFTLVFAISSLIKLIQFITNSGSFDIDDIILNTLGSFIIYLIVLKLYKYIHYFFLEYTFDKKMSNIVLIILNLIYIFVLIYYSIQFIGSYIDNKLDYSNLKCTNNEETFIISDSEYNYYSACTYSGYVLRGGIEKLEIDEFVKTYNTDKMLNKLNIRKEKWLKDINITYTNENEDDLILLLENNYEKYYFYGIKEIDLTINKDNILQEFNISKGYESTNNSDFSLSNLVSLEEYNMKGSYAIFRGEYFDMIGCGSNNYYVPKVLNVKSEFCNNKY